MNEIPKVVFSKTLQRAEWPETRIARGDLSEEIGRLKREPGNDLIAYGGARFDQALTRLGLVGRVPAHDPARPPRRRAPPVQGSARSAAPGARRSDDLSDGRRHSRLPAALTSR